MNKKYTKFIIGGSVLLAIIILIIVYHNVTKIDKNSSSTTGNTPGNLLNGGSFCESGGKIYFSNPYDNNKLYSMDSDCSNIKCLTDDDVSYINCAGRYIYYVKNNAKASNTNSLLRGELYGVVRCALMVDVIPPFIRVTVQTLRCPAIHLYLMVYSIPKM